MRVAIVHDWLVTYAGAERVLTHLLEMYPDADLFSVIDFLTDHDRARIGGKTANTSFIQRLPFARRRYRSYLPLMPLAIEQFDLSGYNLVISSSHAVAKGVLTGPHQAHVSYVHSPMRYAWDLQHQYLAESGMESGIKSWVARWLLHRLRIWDGRTASGVDEFVTNSRFIARRVRKAYGRHSTVVHPPVDISRISFGETKATFYLTASRMVPYKRIDLIVEAFAAMPDKRLVVVGDGPEMHKIRRLVTPNVELLGFQSDDVLLRLMREARAFVFAAEEDFGIAPVEAQASGTPVIAFGRGGALETIVAEGEAPTGMFFHEQSRESIVEAITEFELRATPFEPSHCRANAERFSVENFKTEMRMAVRRAIDAVEMV
jgi:glycosyltransferase involved in cell wall biosynthesis